jgi:hypothetical protein
MTAPLLLLGAQRSGTTALAHALSRAYAEAGGIFTVNGKLPYLLPRWCTPADLTGRHFRADEISHAIDRKPPAGVGVERWRARLDTVLREVAAEVTTGMHSDPGPLLGHVISQAYAEWPCWGDKYNEYLLDLPALLDAVPSARLVLVVRHPLEVAASQLAWSGDRPWRPASVEEACAKWTAWHTEWLTLAPRLPPGRRLVVDYRALCGGGPAVSRLSTFCGMDVGRHLKGFRASKPAATSEPSPDIARVWHELLEMESP